MKFFQGKQPNRQRRSYHPFELDYPLLQLSENEADCWRTLDLVESVLIFGKNGSGKTSSSIACIADAVLQAGYGALIFAAKPDETQLWLNRVRRNGRLEQTIVFNAESSWKFNPISYLYARPGAGSGPGTCSNIASFIMDMLAISEGGEKHGGDDSAYWTRSSRQLLENVLELASMSEGEAQITTAYAILISCANSIEETITENWVKNSACAKHLLQAKAREKTPMEEQDFAITAQYMLETLPALAPRTRSIITQMTSSLIERTFLKGHMREVFSSRTCNLLPELIFDGAIVIMDWNLREWQDLGLLAQSIYAWSFMDAVERRDTNKYPRPVTIFVDEAPMFVSRKMAEFIRTARSSKTGVVLASQGLNAFYNNGMNKESVGDLVGSCGSAILHLNSDPVTNQFASDSIGQGEYVRPNWSVSTGNEGGGGNSSSGGSKEMRYDIPPQYFTQLPKPGPDGLVPAILFAPGKVWSTTGKPYTPVIFPQEPRG